jgi:hypothetical protein
LMLCVRGVSRSTYSALCCCSFCSLVEALKGDSEAR